MKFKYPPDRLDPLFRQLGLIRRGDPRGETCRIMPRDDIIVALQTELDVHIEGQLTQGSSPDRGLDPDLVAELTRPGAEMEAESAAQIKSVAKVKSAAKIKIDKFIQGASESNSGGTSDPGGVPRDDNSALPPQGQEVAVQEDAAGSSSSDFDEFDGLFEDDLGLWDSVLAGDSTAGPLLLAGYP